MGLIDGLLSGMAGGLAGRFGAVAPVNSGEGIPSKVHLGVTDGDAAYDTEAEVLALVGGVGVWTKIWEKTVEAQAQYRFGYGSPAFPHNQGYWFFVIMDEATDFSVGVVRLMQAKAREQLFRQVVEAPDSRLHDTTVTTSETATPTNINAMLALPEKVEFPKVGEDSKLQIWYKLVVAATTADAVAFSVPMTLYQ